MTSTTTRQYATAHIEPLSLVDGPIPTTGIITPTGVYHVGMKDDRLVLYPAVKGRQTGDMLVGEPGRRFMLGSRVFLLDLSIPEAPQFVNC